ncbi:MAG: exodeoxyribonuclease V subunit gamma [Desulfobacterales bacterium]|nr:exodeoxyribonuclease V subunit gamma [Desulfobacterales bacterium]
MIKKLGASMAGFHLYTSNKLEILSQKLSESFREKTLSPLQKEMIIIQSKGMARWLNLEIAKYNKIAANIDFVFPKGFTQKIFGEIVELPKESPFSIDLMIWKIMKILPQLIDKEEFKSIKNYIKGENIELKKFQLSEKIAYLFDQYLIFRPDYILNWDKGENIASNFEHANWQAELWRQLSNHEKSDIKYHNASLKASFIKELKKSTFKFKNFPNRISVFGISTLPQFFMESFAAISEKIDVYFYYFNPCQEFWKDTYSKKEIAKLSKIDVSEEDQYFDVGNSLLGSLGKAGREFFSLILNMSDDMGEGLYYDPVSDSNTMLSRIQSDILNLKERKKNDFVEDNIILKNDTSIQLHSCYSNIREVEVLYDNLLYLFDKNKNLLPKDIVVMMPNVSIYAPFIQAIFDSPESDNKRIPYSIADNSLRATNKIAQAFLSILSIDKERFKASEVLDILQTDAVLKKFRLTERDIDTIKVWVNESNIRWGIDGKYKKQIGLPAFNENSWKFGIDKMLLGYALFSLDNDQIFEGILPYREIEGSSALILGKFINFINSLFKCSERLSKHRTLLEWSQYLNTVLNDFFISNEDTDNDIKIIREFLTDKGLMKFAEFSGFTEEISLDIIYSYLFEQFEKESAPHGFISTGVTFCTILPMRSIPFKIIYLLGMNDGEYPRNSQKIGFNLMEKKRKLCDRSKRDEDKFLFLEAILSARENLIISYIGKHLKDNTNIPPSSVVSELSDYIKEAFTLETGDNIIDYITINHPLQPFSPMYYKGDTKLFSYSKQNCLGASELEKDRNQPEPFFVSKLPNPTDEWKFITIEQLIRFFKNPSTFILKNRLNVSLEDNNFFEITDIEPFNIDKLKEYMIKDELLRLSFTKNNDYFEIFKASGNIPHGWQGEYTYNSYAEKINLFLESIKEKIEIPLISKELNFKFDTPDINLKGKLKNLYSSGQVLFRPSTIKPKDQINAWIRHLALNSIENYRNKRDTLLFGIDKKQKNITYTKYIKYTEIEIFSARTLLADLINIFWKGLTFPIRFYPKLSLNYAEKFNVKKNPYDDKNDQKDCIYIETIFGAAFADNDEFKDMALKIFKPMLKHRKIEN